MRSYVQGVILAAVCLAAIGVSCRRSQPSLVDRNQAPDTQLWYAPPDSTEYEYLVHLYWRGTDGDGTAQRFIWTIQDTVVTNENSWNPAARISDYRLGRITERTDSIFAFTAFKNVAGVGVRKNRQAFYIAAIDDNGVIDPSPASVEFVASIPELPQIRFVIYPAGKGTTPHQYPTPPPPIPADTVGMFSPFAISYHGITSNGSVRGYQYFPLSTTIILPGQNIWTENIADTLREFPNTIDTTDELPAGVFKFAAQCIDDANAESAVDAGQFTEGVAQVVVNFDPDTWITEVVNTYFRNSAAVVETVDFTDGVPDTVPNNSLLYYQYNSLDDDRDTWECSVTDPDKCIDFQIKYLITSASNSFTEDSGWLPRNGEHDSDPNAATDSNTVRIGSLEYDWFVRGIDENSTADGTPPKFHVVGNFDPILDTTSMVDHLGNVVNLATVDTLSWDFFKPIGWPAADSTADPNTGFAYEKHFAWTISATGHEHPKDPPTSTVQSWRYFAFTNYVPSAGQDPGTGTAWTFGRSGASWFPSVATNTMSDGFELVVRYNNVDGSDLIPRLPAYFNKVISIALYGRDTRASGGGEFSQVVYWDAVPPNAAAGDGISEQFTINTFAAAPLGRWTPKEVVSFYLKMDF
jgi:hypothetical protein